MILLCKGQKILFTHCLCIVHESHDTILTFKNYFVIMFSISIKISSIQMDPEPLPLFPYDHDKTGSVHKGEKNGWNKMFSMISNVAYI